MDTKILNRVVGFVIGMGLGFSANGTEGAAPAKSDYELFDPLVDVCDLIAKQYVTETKSDELVAGAINGMLHQLDPYSEFIPASELDDFQKQTGGSYEGIGVVVDIKEGYLTVVSPFEESPAYQAGVRSGDVIIEVNGRATKGWSTTRAVTELTGPAGTSVVLRIVHENGKEETLTIARQKIVVPTVRGWRRGGEEKGWDYLLDEENGVAYVRVTQFSADTAAELDRVVEPMLKQPMKALILDLRNNPGGLMSEAVAIVDRFVDQGVIVTTRGAHSEPVVQKAEAAGTWPRFPLVVMIDQGSASASEIVAGSLQDNNRAVIVGKRSWGKGSVQRVFKLPESGASLKLTTDYYYLPKGRCLHRRDDSKTWGVDPDVEQELDAEKLPLLRKLIEKLGAPAAESKDAKGAVVDIKDEDKAAAESRKRKDQADQLMVLDDQLSQAYKQCRGLLRSRATLQSLSETMESK